MAGGKGAVSSDEATVFEGGDHVSHGLGGDEGVAGELGNRHVGVAFQDRERGVLQGGQPIRPEQLV